MDCQGARGIVFHGRQVVHQGHDEKKVQVDAA